MSGLPSSDTRSRVQISRSKRRAPDELEKIAVRQALERREQLFFESEPANNVYRVIDGVLKAYKLLRNGRCQVTGFLFPGDFAGVEHSSGYAYSVDAVTPSTVERYRSRDFRQLIEREGRLGERLLGVVVHELCVAQDQMLLLGRRTAEQRVAAFLLMLSERAVARGEPGNPLYVPMTCADIADHLGLTTETISRMYTRLRNRGVISRRTNGEVQILDRGALTRLQE